MDIVYVLTNPAMPGLVKIGYSSREDAKARIAELYKSGVPVPFETAYAATVENGRVVEDALHTAFAPDRINPKREFFQIDPEQSIAILRLFQTANVTGEIDKQPSGIDAESLAAGDKLQKRRPRIDFHEMGIPNGSVLHFEQGDAQVTVIGPRSVMLNNEEMYLTTATRQLLNLDYNVAPSVYWRFNGRLLKEIYDETYEAEG